MIVKFEDDDIREFYAEVDCEIRSMRMKASLGDDGMMPKRPRPKPGQSSTGSDYTKSQEADVAWWRCLIPPKRKDRWDLAKLTALVVVIAGGYLALLIHYFTNPAVNVMVLLACMFTGPFAIPITFISVGGMIDDLNKSIRDNRRLVHSEQRELRESERQEREEMLK